MEEINLYLWTCSKIFSSEFELFLCVSKQCCTEICLVIFVEADMNLAKLSPEILF